MLRRTAWLALFALACAGEVEEETAAEEVTPPTSAGGAAQPDAAATRDVRLTREGLEQWFVAAEALNRVATRNPSLEDAVTMNLAESADVAVQRLNAVPEARTAIGEADLSVEQYVHTGFALMQALLAVGAQQQGTLQELPRDVDAADVQFVRDNRDWIQQRMGALSG